MCEDCRELKVELKDEIECFNELEEEYIRGQISERLSCKKEELEFLEKLLSIIGDASNGLYSIISDEADKIESCIKELERVQ